MVWSSASASASGSLKDMCHGTFWVGILCAMAHFAGVNLGKPTPEEEDIGYFYGMEYILTMTGAG